MRVIDFFGIKAKRLLGFLSTSVIICTLFCPFAYQASATSIPSEITITYPYYAFIEDKNNPWQTVFDALDTTDTINYNDTFFDEPSPGDHPKLRAVSYALALAGYENQADGYPADPSNPNPKLYNLLDQLGFSDYESWDISSEENGHSMGTTIAHKTLANGQELIVIAPRNYNYMTEWLSNFNVGTTGDHAGFTESANLIINRFNQYIESHNLSNYKTWAVGYSRGGAVIDLFGKAINANLANYQMVPDDFYVYTFGAPKASTIATNYSNIHDVKDGNDLILGYVFPELWGFYNTGTYEEIHPADLNVTTSMINISDLANPATALNILSNNEGLTEDVKTINGRDFMDDWLSFVNENGLTRTYFDSEVKPPLSAIMKIYQTRTLDHQSELTDFLKDTEKGLPYMVAINAFVDLMNGGYGTTLEEALSNFPPYLDIVKVLKGTANDADVDELVVYLTNYIGQYSDYEMMLGGTPPITENELDIIKTNLPQLIKALAPLLIADGQFTQTTYGEEYSLYYTYSLIKNAENLVIGHIPESIMPILKSLIPVEDPIKVPSTGQETYRDSISATTSIGIAGKTTIASLFGAIIFIVFLGCSASRRKPQ